MDLNISNKFESLTASSGLVVNEVSNTIIGILGQIFFSVLFKVVAVTSSYAAAEMSITFFDALGFFYFPTRPVSSLAAFFLTGFCV